MKGDVFGLTRTTIIVIALLAFFIFSMFFVTQYGVIAGITGCGDPMICEPGETALFCDECKEPEMFLIPEHLVVFKDDLVSNLGEIEKYIKYPIGEINRNQDGEDCINCEGCWDSQDYREATTCEECDGCNSITGKCDICTTCEKALSDHITMDTPYGDGNVYESCEFCADCQSCEIEDQGVQADKCARCSYCLICGTDDKRDYDKCDYCSFQNRDTSSNVVATGCSICYDNDETEVISTTKYFNLCESCQSCNAWEQAEPTFCERVKTCIANYNPDNPEPCIVDYQLSAEQAGTGSTVIYNAIKQALSECTSGPVFRELSDSGRQFVCNYDSGISTKFVDNQYFKDDFYSSYSPPTWLDVQYGENWFSGDRDATYFQCGHVVNPNQMDYNYNVITFNDWQFSKETPEGLYPPRNYRISIGYVDFGMEYNTGGWVWSDKKCRFNMFVCAQPSFVVLDSENDLSSSYENPLMNIYASLITIDDEDLFYFKEAPYYAIKTKVIEVNLGEDPVNIDDIADALVAGTRDWVSMSETYPNTLYKIDTLITEGGELTYNKIGVISTFKTSLSEYTNFDDMNGKYKIKMNDKILTSFWDQDFISCEKRAMSWTLVPLDPSLREHAYGRDPLLHVYQKSTNQVFNQVHEYDIPKSPMEYSDEWMVTSEAVKYPIEANLNWEPRCTKTTVSLHQVDTDNYVNKKLTDSKKTITIGNNVAFETLIGDDQFFNYKMPTEIKDYFADEMCMWGKDKIRLKSDGTADDGYSCGQYNSEVVFKYSLATKGDNKYIYYENYGTGTYSGKIQIQLMFYVESEYMRIENDPILVASPYKYNYPREYPYVNNTILLTPMISIRQVS